MDGDGSYSDLIGALVMGAVAALLLLCNALANPAVTTLGRTRIRALAEARQRAGMPMLRLDDVTAPMVAAISVTDTLLIALFVGVATQLGIANGQGIFAALLAGVALLLGRAIAGMIGFRAVTLLLPIISPYLTLLVFVTMPARWLLNRLSLLLRGPAIDPDDEDGLSAEEIRVLATVAGDPTGEAQIEEAEREMIASIIGLSQTTAREVMVPRIDIVGLPVETPLIEALDAVVTAGHSRVPIYSENIDSIQGILYAKDLLAYLRDGKTDIPIRDLLRPAHFVPESKKADELLKGLQQSHVHIAIVIDEYGGTAGMVTIEDVLEEIVGEIQDEYDAEEPFIEMVSPYEAICNARVDLDDLNWTMDIALPTEESDTLGGLIYVELGKVPLVGDTVLMEAQGVRIEVMAVAGRRITKVRVVKLQPPGEGHAKEAEGEAEATATDREQAVEAHESRDATPHRLFGFARRFSTE